LEVFRAEAEEHLQSIDSGATALQRSPEDRETLQSVRRATHTLKGAAAMMGFGSIADLSHIFEDLLDRMMEGSIEINNDALSLILDTSEALELLVTGRASERGGDAAVVAVLRPRYQSLLGQENLGDASLASAQVDEEYLSGSQAETSGDSEDAAAQTEHGTLVSLASHAEASEKSELSVRIRLKKLDELVDLFGELLVNRSVLEERLGRLMRMVSDVGLSSTRLQEVGTQLESRFEAATLPSRHGGQEALLERSSVAGSTSGPLEQNAGSRGRSLTLPPGIIGGNVNKLAEHLADFDELELDRYNEFHRLTRGLSEGVSDMSTLSLEMETLLRECESIFLKESRLSSSFQDQLLKVRLVPISTMVPRLNRAASAVALRLGKEIDLVVEGEETEVDRTIYEEMADALLHVVRNAVTHAIELPEVREAAGKSREGHITLSASHEGNQIVVTVRDDGTGIDAEKVRNTAISRGLLDARAPLSEQAVLNLIFRPGFSTAESITEESGRGVGLDVVADVAARLRGSVEVESTPGNGSAFTLRFPISVQIQRAVLARVSDQTYAVPMALVEQIGRLDYSERTNVLGVPAIMVRGEAYALVHLATLLGMEANRVDERASVLLVVAGRQRYALVVDSVIGKQEIVAKSLGLHLREVRGVAGATVLGNGQVVLILDVLNLLENRTQTVSPSFTAVSSAAASTSPSISAVPTRLLAPTWTSSLPSIGRGPLVPPPARMEDQYVLVVDDSPSVRRVVSNMLKTAGWEVQTARDGIEALDVAGKRKPAAVLLDIEMPRMDGYELIATLRSQDQYKHLPLVVLTSRAAGKHHQRAMQLGADAYLVKPYQDEELINTLNTLVRGAQASS
jgi:chemotaxis protein histidine kinase CheA/ActR/RegA family two-component response regulator